MKRQFYPALLLALTLLILILAGCGDDEVYIASDSLVTVPFSGVVEDGPISGAKISLRDKDGTYYPLYDSLGNANYEIKTDPNGAFSLEVKAGIDFSNLSVHAVGGIDRDTGMDFSGLEMRSPLGLYQGDVTAIVVSPLTTLVAELHDQGLSFEDAEKLLRGWLDLPPDVNLASRPSDDGNLQVQLRTLLLGKIALEMKATQPFNLISKEVVKQKSLLWDENNKNDESFKQILSSLGLEDIEIERITSLKNSLMDPDPDTGLAVATKERAFYFYKREELMHIFDDNFKGMLHLTAPFDVNYQANIKKLAETTLDAAGSEVILLVEPIPSRLFRYLRFTYKLTTPESLTLDLSAFLSNLTYGENNAKVALEDDPWIALLAKSSSANSVDSPLLLNELPGGDTQKRMDYFYGSDISPHLQAERLIGKVFDDAVNDEVMVKVVEGKANAGLIEEARIIISTQIFQSESKANAYRTLANALINYNRMEEARSSLDLARILYRQVITAKGGEKYAGSKDIDNIMATSNSYRKAGDLVQAQNLLDYVYGIAQVFLDNNIIATTYGNVISGIKKVADIYISEGNLEAATPLVESMHNYSGQTPDYLGTYKLRISNWSESAKRYADLGDGAMVIQVLSDIQTLRANDGLQNLTEAATWSFIPDLAESLYRVGAEDEALSLANTIPSNLSHQSKAYKLVATYEALQGNLEKSFSIVDNTSYFPKNEDKIELLTYYTRARPYIAQVLIDAGHERFSEARQVLEKAEGLLDGMTSSNNFSRISNGYVKVAELYARMGDGIKAEGLLQKAQEAIIDDVYRVSAIIDIALGYHSLGLTNVALPLLDSAKNLADTNPTLCRVSALAPTNLVPAEYATLIYKKLILAYEAIEDNNHVYTTVNLYLTWAAAVHPAGTVNDPLAVKECDFLLSGALYLDRAGYHGEALNTLNDAKNLTTFKLVAGKIVGEVIATPQTFFAKYLNVITTYTAVLEYDEALFLAWVLPLTTERNQAIQTLANAYIDRDDFPETWVASIDSDSDGKPDFFNPLASAEEIAAPGLILDDDSDGDGIVDTLDIRPLFKD